MTGRGDSGIIIPGFAKNRILLIAERIDCPIMDDADSSDADRSNADTQPNLTVRHNLHSTHG